MVSWMNRHALGYSSCRVPCSMTYPKFRQLKLQVSVFSNSSLTCICFRNNFMLTKPCRSIFFSVLLSDLTNTLLNCLKNNKTFVLLLLGIFNSHFKEKFGKHSVSENYLFRRKLKQTSLFPIVLRGEGEFDFKCSNGVFRIAQAFASFWDGIWCENNLVLIRICRKTSFLEILWFRALWDRGLIFFEYC